MRFIEQPLVREFLFFLSIVVLIVFCFDKSRQNKRTRYALYNCVYPLYGSAVFKAAQLLDAVFSGGTLGHIAALLTTVVALPVYWRWFRRQPDIPYNRLFHTIGWVVLAIVLVFFLAMSIVGLLGIRM